MTLTETDYSTAPCLESGPIAQAAQAFVEAAARLGESRSASIIRAWSVAHIFGQTEALFASGEEPISGFNRLLTGTAEIFKGLAGTGFLPGPAGPGADTNGESVETITGNHYGNLFKGFSQAAFWEETAKLLRIRLERNAIDLTGLEKKTLLDVGCGGGRYTAAWKSLGAGEAVGVDISAINIADAQRRVSDAGMKGVRYELGDVLQLPYPENSFDIVFSNGVLHHTRDWNKGIAELLRVLKPGGLGWLYLIENPGGLFWDSIEILRAVMRNEQHHTARTALQMVGVPGNRIFYMLDHVMVPINERLTPAQIEKSLASAGATGIRRLTRGSDFDRVEQIYLGAPYAEIKYGVGENRYVFSKA